MALDTASPKFKCKTESVSYGFPLALKGVLESVLRKICTQAGAWELLSNLFNV